MLGKVPRPSLMTDAASGREPRRGCGTGRKDLGLNPENPSMCQPGRAGGLAVTGGSRGESVLCFVLEARNKSESQTRGYLTLLRLLQHRLHGLNNRSELSRGSGGWKAHDRALEGPVPGESSLPGLQAAFLFSGVSSSHRDTNPIGLCPCLMTSCYLKYLLKALYLSLWGLGLQRVSLGQVGR